jgi:hypothetical protein
VDGAADLGAARAAAFLLFAGMSFLIGVSCGYRSGESRVYRIETAPALRYHPLASRRVIATGAAKQAIVENGDLFHAAPAEMLRMRPAAREEGRILPALRRKAAA